MENMPKNYDAEVVEQRMLDKWLAGDYYRPQPRAWAIARSTIPPPNVTGKLHMGHALDDTIQDTYHPHDTRMRGVSDPLDLGHRPCGHRHADQGGQEARVRGNLPPARSAARSSSRPAGTGRDEYGGHHRRADQAHGLLRSTSPTRTSPWIAGLRHRGAQGLLRLVP